VFSKSRFNQIATIILIADCGCLDTKKLHSVKKLLAIALIGIGKEGPKPLQLY
jgi:hypothetical protein